MRKKWLGEGGVRLTLEKSPTMRHNEKSKWDFSESHLIRLQNFHFKNSVIDHDQISLTNFP